jgi:myo-inositol-1-phosphate synthase
MSKPFKKNGVAPATGKLGILVPGLGAVSTTFMIGVKAILNGLGQPFGSLTQMGHIRLGKRTDKKSPLIKDFISLTPLENIEFGGWDITEENCYQVALRSHVIFRELVEKLKDEIEPIKPYPAVFDQKYVSRLNGNFVKKGKTKYDLARQLMDDISRFKEEKKVDRMVMVWCGSTEAYLQPGPVHQTIEAFEKGLKDNDPTIAPSMMYAYAAIMSGVPYANGAPNLTVDTPALVSLAKEKGVPICGKDFKTGQTLMKNEDDHRARFEIAPHRRGRMVFHKYFRESGRRGFGRA